MNTRLTCQFFRRNFLVLYELHFGHVVSVVLFSHQHLEPLRANGRQERASVAHHDPVLDLQHGTVFGEPGEQFDVD